MIGARRRSRMVNFRVTDEEYAQVLAAGSAAGARGVSDFVRSIVLIETTRARERETMDRMAARLDALSARLEQVLSKEGV